MMTDAAMGDLRAELHATASMIRAAYPRGVPEAAYRPLLALLYEGMSFRGVAEVMSRCTGRPYSVVYNDTLGAVAGGKDVDSLDVVRQTLRSHGYDEWLANAD